MNILLWIIFGGVAGWVATLIVGQGAAFGVFGNIVVGIVGAIVGGWISDSVGADETSDAERPTSILSFLWAVIGAVVLLFVLGLLF
ncbi:MAG: GlsB/YeaQ/YmgE family stress response membrane protein [Parcubacteria group bacterium SW_4_46_8]|nr:MAG: GlsB/YeaQ/YmgE family stress response membrane protein [Parcubacteria group bacterium SW_4_46_8]